MREYERCGIELDYREEDAQVFAADRLDWIGMNYYATETVAEQPEEGAEGAFFGGMKNPYLTASDWGWTSTRPHGFALLARTTPTVATACRSS